MDKKPEKKTQKKTEKKPAPPRPKKGDKVEIIIKPYNKKITKIGVVKDVLTKAKKHTRGHKVRLEDGTIGRVIVK
jgi:uncharacterized repeat protein (TIGR03833 family)